MAKIRDAKAKIIRFALCGVQGCCPTVEINHGTGKIVITDDNDGQVTLTKEQWREAITKVKIDT